jgi:hypothetical protein
VESKEEALSMPGVALEGFSLFSEKFHPRTIAV